MINIEVTNSDFLKFVKKVVIPIQIIGRMEAMTIKSFVDKTGFKSPSTWELGTYPFGKSDYPVSGISWYEALAYCKSLGKLFQIFINGTMLHQCDFQMKLFLEVILIAHKK